MRVFVTGGNGFIGSAVVRALVAAGHSALCLLRDASSVERLEGLPFERARGDVRSVESLREPMAACDATIHLAAPGGWEKDEPSLLRAVIEDGTRHVLDTARALVDHRVVVVSSTAAIGASNTPIVFNENTSFAVGDASLHYAHSKHRAEMLTIDAARRGTQAIIVNPAEVYGPGDTALVSASNLIDFATSTPVLVCRGGTSVVHVDDVAAGILAALTRGRVGERYILGGENLTVTELAELVLELMNRKARIVNIPNGIARAAAHVATKLPFAMPFNPHVVPYATRYWFVDNDKAQRELGVSFRPARETIRSALEWLVETGRLSGSVSRAGR